MRDSAAREHSSTETEAHGPGLRAPFSGDVRQPQTAVRRRLAKLIAAKLLLDLLFVGALAAYAYADTFRDPFEGALEQTDGRVLRGWVVNRSEPDAPVEVQLFLDGRFAVAGLADKPLTEVGAEEPGAAGRRGFVFEFDPTLRGEHEARVYAVGTGRGGARRTLRQIGPKRVFAWR